MKLYLVLLGQIAVSLAASVTKVLDQRLVHEYQGFELQRRTSDKKTTPTEPKLEPWPSFRNSAGGARARQHSSPSSAHKPSPDQSLPSSGNPSSGPASSQASQAKSLKRDRSPSSISPQAERSTPSRGNLPVLNPSRSRSPSVSGGSWNGFGFTSSSSPSSWGSIRYHSEVNPVEASASAKGPAVIRSRTEADKHRTYKDVKKGQTDRVDIEDPNKVQTAVHARRGGQGTVSASHAIERAESSRIVVDARRSKLGGWIHFADEDGQSEREDVPPGKKHVRWASYKVKGFIHGPGKAKVTTTNGGWEDTDASSGYSS